MKKKRTDFSHLLKDVSNSITEKKSTVDITETLDESANQPGVDAKKVDSPENYVQFEEKREEPQSTQALNSVKKIYNIPINRIHDNPYNARKNYNPGEIEKLAESIRQTGFSGSIEVKEHPEKAGHYIQLFGHKRRRACILAGLQTMPCDIVTKDALSSRKTSFLENFSRSDISVIEQANELKALKSDFDEMSTEGLAQLTSMSKTDIYRYLKILELPRETINALDTNAISLSHAKCLLKYIGEDDEFIITATQEIINKSLSVKALERLIKKHKKESRGGSKNDSIEEQEKLNNISSIQNQISQKFDTATIKPSKIKGGKIVLPYESDDDLNSLLKKLL